MSGRASRNLLACLLVVFVLGACAPGRAPTPGGGAATRIPRPTGIPSIPRAPSQQTGPLSGLVRVDAGDDWFLPEVVTITAGSTVRWYHVGEEAHNAFALDGSWGTTEFGIGSYAEHRFNTTGRYPYQCTLHAPGMRGVIVVVAK